MEIIRNDHNYTPFTTPEQLKAQKTAEKLIQDKQAAQGRKIVVQTHATSKVFNTKKRFQVMPFTQAKTSQLPPRQQQQLPSRQSQQLSPKQLQQLPRQHISNLLQQSSAFKQQQNIIVTGPRQIRNIGKVLSPQEEVIDDDEDANSSATADEENAESEELSEPSDISHETDNDRDSDIDFKMNNSRNSNKRKRIKKLSRRSHVQSSRGQAVLTSKTPVPPTQQQFPSFKRRKEQADSNLSAPAIGQIVQLNTNKAPQSVIALGRGMQSTSFLKMRPAHKSLPVTNNSIPEINKLCSPSIASKVRRTPIVHVGRVVSTPASSFLTPTQSQEVKEIIINKNLSSPKGVFTNLNSLLAENNSATLSTTASTDHSKQRQIITPVTPKSTVNSTLNSLAAPSSKGFMPIGVDTATSHKLPAQIVIETHQSSSELAAENDKQLDLINSIVQDELLKASVIEHPPETADENIPKLAKMLESSAARLSQVPEPKVIIDNTQSPQQQEQQNFNDPVNNINIGSARLLDTPDEDEITADFLQHVVGLIKEDKQFEAEVVKQVLASTETGGLDAIANAVSSPIFESANQLSTITQVNFKFLYQITIH